MHNTREKMSMLEHLDALTDQEAREAHARLAMRLSKQRDFSADEQDLWDALCVALNVRAPISLNKFVDTFGVSKYREAVTAAHGYLTQSCALILRRPSRKVLLATIMECLVDNVRERGIPVTPGTVLGNIGTLAFAVEESFPGYADARMLHRIATVAQFA